MQRDLARRAVEAAAAAWSTSLQHFFELFIEEPRNPSASQGGSGGAARPPSTVSRLLRALIGILRSLIGALGIGSGGLGVRLW